jgi:prevent-host-death family protein
MPTATMEEVQAHLPEMLDRVQGGEELLITRAGKPVARLTGRLPRSTPVLGTGKGTVLYVAPDFDAPLDEFREYME